MKIDTEFDQRIKQIYGIIALPYPPKTVSSDEIFDDVEIEELVLDIKSFVPKIQAFNINKDLLTNHKASKQLSKFIEDSERRRRANDKEESQHPEDYLRYKENVVGFINSLASKAKVEKAQRDSKNTAKLKEDKVELLDNIRRFSNSLKADKEEFEEQQRRIDECHEIKGQIDTMHLINQLTPIHDQLTASFEKSSGSVQDLLRQASSDEFASMNSSQSDVSKDKSIEVNARMKNMFNSAQYSTQEDLSRCIDTDVLQGAGRIGRTLKRANKTFQDNLHQISENSRKKSEVQSELLVHLTKASGKKLQGKAQIEKTNKDKMCVVLDSVVHKVTGKQVEKEISEGLAKEEFDYARRDTLDKIKDYGRRKSVLENADTSYTKIKKDEKSTKNHAVIMKTIGKNDTKAAEKNKKKVPKNPLVKKQDPLVKKERRPTGPPKPELSGHKVSAAPTYSSPPGFRKPSSPNPAPGTTRKASSPHYDPTGAPIKKSSSPKTGVRKASSPHVSPDVSPRGIPRKPSKTGQGATTRWK